MPPRRAGYLLAASVLAVASAIPAEPHYFTQLVDHFSGGRMDTFSQRFYENSTWFKGPGSPILMILGGEGAIPPSTGIFYPFVTDVLARRFHALVVEPEHRFYGESLPFGPESSFTDKALRLATPQQALADAAHFVQSIRAERGCTGKPGTPGYCPVITIGGSYPGWLSAMMRMRYPSVIDAAYAASAPMKFYSQEVDQFAYYKVVTDSADKSVPGCGSAVRAALAALSALSSKSDILSALGVCDDPATLPEYIRQGDVGLLKIELNMVFMYTFADLNMANYPPKASGLREVCTDLVAPASRASPLAALKRLLAFAYPSSTAGSTGRNMTRQDKHLRLESFAVAARFSQPTCFDLSAQVPSGTAGTISGGDWSGCGAGRGGQLWDFETCGFLVERIGVNNVTDMFPPRKSTSEWLDAHCAARFGGQKPQPTALAQLWGFGTADLAYSGATKIVFTNGLNDGWSAGGITSNVGSPGLNLLAVNMENGAHHSDLSHFAPDPAIDTPDVTAARARIGDILNAWINDTMPLTE